MSEELILLNKHLQLLIQYLRVRKLKKFPVHILIGQAGSGKTSLLRSLDFEFDTIIPAIKSYKTDLQTQVNANHPHITPNSEYCHWWLTDKGAILDIPSHFLTADEHSTDNQLWQQLLTFFKKNKRWLVIHSLTYVINLDALTTMPQNDLQASVAIHKIRLFELSRHLKTKLPLYFMITKMDYIVGFSEFFDDLRSDERTQCLGCQLTKVQNSQGLANKQYHSLIDIFRINFENLIKQLQTHVITRVHHERNQHKRSLIVEFPLQLETLANQLIYLLTELGEKAAYCDAVAPQGIYFASSIQEKKPTLDYLHQAVTQQFDLKATQQTATLNHHRRSYFINHFFSDLLANADKLAKATGHHLSWQEKLRSNKQALLMTSGSLALILALALTLQISYHHSHKQLTKSEFQLKQAQTIVANLAPAQTSISQTLTALNQILQAEKDVQQLSPFFRLIDFFVTSPLEDKINALYQSALEKLLLPQLSSALENTLLTSSDPSANYAALKAYLMLQDLNNRQPIFLSNWAMSYFRSSLTDYPGYEMILRKATLDLFTTSNLKLNLNPLALNQAKNTLASLPPAYLGYLVLVNQSKGFYDEPFSINHYLNKNTPLVVGDQGIPFFYTMVGYQKVFLPQLDQLMQLKNNDLWVLQSLNDNQLLLNMANAGPAIIAMYLHDYNNYWQNYLNTIVFGDYHSLTSISNLLTNITNKPALLKEIFQAISYNLSSNQFNHIASLDNKNIALWVQQAVNNDFSSNLIATQELLATYANSPTAYKNLSSNLANLNNYVQAVQNASDPLKAAFEAAALHATAKTNIDPLNNIYALANSVPAPIQTWLNNIANTVWQSLLSMTTTFINQQWQTQVMPVYNTTISNRFPVFSTANTDISVHDFTNFFAPGGVLDSFYSNYLQPFVDTSSVTWNWRTINNQSLALNANTPEIFERASIIRQMYYPSNNNQLQIQFSLEANSVAPTITKMQLNFGNQSMLVTPGQHAATNFVWPNAPLSANVNIALNGFSTPSVSDNKTGAFALFRLLNDTTIQTTNDPRRYIVNFAVSGTPVAQYILTTNNMINPFIPNIINEFRCTPTL